MNGRQKRWASMLRRLRADARRRELDFLTEALDAADWSVTYAARALGLRLSSLQAMIARHPSLLARQQARAPGLGHDETGRFVLATKGRAA